MAETGEKFPFPVKSVIEKNINIQGDKQINGIQLSIVDNIKINIQLINIKFQVYPQL